MLLSANLCIFPLALHSTRGEHTAAGTCRRELADSTSALMAAVSLRSASVASLDARLVAWDHQPALSGGFEHVASMLDKIL